jgi:hypothetical protein
VKEYDEVRLQRASSIVERTAGILKGNARAVSMKDERIAVEDAIATESEERSAK